MLRIEINTGNAAFGDNRADAATECARLLFEISTQLLRADYDGTVRDINGNRCGTFVLTPDRED